MKYELGNKCQMTSHWLWVLMGNPLLLLCCRLKDSLSWSIIVFLQFACDPHASSREEKRSSSDLRVVTQEYFFRPMHAAWTHFYTFIRRHEKPSDCLGLDQKSTECLYLVTLCLCLGHSLYIQYQHVKQGPF